MNSIKYEHIIYAVIVIIITYLPFLINGQSSYIEIFDNLDSEFVYLHLLKEHSLLFNFEHTYKIPNIFGGLPKYYIHSDFNIIRLYFFIFPSFYAYIINSIVIRLIGFIGIIYLSHYHIPSYDKKTTYFIAIMFSLLPVYSLYGISILGQPLLLWSYLNLQKEKMLISSYIFIIIFAFYSHLAMAGIFIIFSLILFGIYSYSKSKKKLLFWIGIMVLIVSYIVANYFTLYNFLFGIEKSHRIAMNMGQPIFMKMLKKAISPIFLSHHHAATFLTLPILILIIYHFRFQKKLHYILFLTISISLFYGFYPFIRNEFKSILPFLMTFQFKRIILLVPFLYFLSLLIINQKIKINRRLYISLLIIQLGIIFVYNKEIYYNFKYIGVSNRNDLEMITFKSFFSNNLFKDIDNFIGISKNSYNILCVGFYPSIAQYNGFQTLDSYQNNYPLSYKLKFRKIIEEELKKSKTLTSYFDNWGNRCYLFSSELEKTCYLTCRKENTVSIKNLSINIKQIKHMGGKYIFSAVPIRSINMNPVNFKKKFTTPDSEWSIFLYEL